MSKKQAEFLQWFGPLLDALRDLGDSGKPREVSNRIAHNLRLPEAVLDVTVKTGQNRFHNQVAWARQYLVWEGLLDSSKHGTWRLTEKGKKARLTEQQARRIFLKWVRINREKRQHANASACAQPEDSPSTSQEVDGGCESIDLLSVLQQLSPSGFEKVIRELLRESGFEQVAVTGKGPDDGIDGYGTLALNPFVSFKVLFQCKRYKNGKAVTRPQVGEFRNAIMGRAEKGIFITTSSFTKAAIDEANRDGVIPVELVDGAKLVSMFEHVELGLTKRTVYDIDLAFFEKYQ